MDQPPRIPRPRLPAFHPVPVRARADGWTPLRQAEFIGMLGQTGSVSAAARFVGRSRETAYRLRRRPGAEEFARAWDMALAIHARRGMGRDALAAGPEGPVTACARKVTCQPSWRQVIDGLWRPVIRRGRYVGTSHKPDDSALLGYLAQLDRALRAEREAARRTQKSQAQKDASLSRANNG